MITEKEIKYIANLSDIYIREEDIPDLISDMEGVIAFAETINGFDCGKALSEFSLSGECILREDEIIPSCPVEDMLSNVPLHKDGYVLLRKRE